MRQETSDARRFEIAVRRLADSLSHGTDASPFTGSGIDYVQSRPYAPGDPVRSIDWRVTARTGRPHVKEYTATKRIPVWLLVDTSASMCVSSLPQDKQARAVQAAGGLALAALARMSPVGLVGCGDRDLHVRPSLSRQQVFLWMHRLRGRGFDERTTLARRLRDLAPALDQRSLLILLTDLHDPEALPPLRSLAQRHDCVVLQFQDPAERGNLGGGIFRAEEAETGTAFTARGAGYWLDAGAAAASLRSAGIDHLLLPTDQPMMPPLRLFFSRRVNLGRGSR